MPVVSKYPLEIVDVQQISLPFGSQVLDVVTQDGKPFLFVLVDDRVSITTNRSFWTILTGQKFDNPTGTYIATFQLPERGLVFHVFEV